jgi:transposase
MDEGAPERRRGRSSTASSGFCARALRGTICRAAIPRIRPVIVAFSCGNDPDALSSCSSDSPKTCEIAARSICPKPSSTPRSPRQKREALPLALLDAVREARSWRSATAMVFLSPSTWPALHRMSRTSSPPPSTPASSRTTRLIGDRGYDSDALDERLMTQYGIEMIAAHRRGRRSTQDGRQLRRARRRWKIERLFAWLHNSRRLVTRWERHVDNFLGLLHLACARIFLRHL